MKHIAVLHADLAVSPIGTRSRLADPLARTPVLRRTVERLARSRELASIHVLCPRAQCDAVEAILRGTPAQVEANPLPPPPYEALVRAARCWGLESWRGGIAGLCAFDEDTHLEACARLAEQHAADGVAVVPAGAALIDPALSDAMIAHDRRHRELVRFVFCQAPPGVAPVLFHRDLLRDLVATRQPPGAALLYRPENPHPDLTGKTSCYRPASVVIESRGRLIADNDRAFARLEALLAAGAADWSAERLADALIARRWDDPASWPEEIEIELTTDDALADRTTLRPRGTLAGVPKRGPLSVTCVKRLVDDLGEFDDVRIVLGGFGEPALHPQLAEIVALLRASAVRAIAVRTSALAGNESFDALLFDAPIDVVIVPLDAHSAETYRRIHGLDVYDRALQRLHHWTERRSAARAVRPLLVPEFMKTTENLDEMERFFDEWLQRLGTAVIVGPSHFSGQRPDLRVTRVTPPRRTPCRQLFRSALILADGTVVTCDQDYAARQPVGHLGRASFREIWSGPQIRRLRDEHRRGVVDVQPLCSKCEEWHRP